MAFTRADRFQARACFMFYSSVFGWEYTEEEWEAFWERVACFQFSTALLQQYFFQGRRNKVQMLLNSFTHNREYLNVYELKK